MATYRPGACRSLQIKVMALAHSGTEDPCWRTTAEHGLHTEFWASDRQRLAGERILQRGRRGRPSHKRLANLQVRNTSMRYACHLENVPWGNRDVVGRIRVL
jgi:hypothetical protein